MADLCAMLDTAVAAMDGSHAALQNSSSTLISANEDLLSRANAFGARALGQVAPARDSVRQGAVAALQKGEHAVDCADVALEIVAVQIDRAAALCPGLRDRRLLYTPCARPST